ncbi:unnamed protein product [Arabis nemorensis]|uniref:B box-type domain-containing protein n=1 Tax=Arabis nemorensis TaxID=586526 RepID=A0A565C3L6_9BRAS|nr:unnamed protein product [Arabis nemorensis]
MAIEDHENPNREIKPKNNRRIMGAGGVEEEENRWPPWLKPLLKENFFVQCEFHSGSSKRECNMYCLDCTNGSLCYTCLAHHKEHRIIQIRRSSYHDVIRVNEIQKFLDIRSIQTYVINSAKVVFLNQRPQPRPGKGVGATSACKVCYRGLVDDCFCFCSLGCKVAGTSSSCEEKRVKHTPMESENSSNSSGVDNNISNPQSLSPSTPQVPTFSSKRRRPRKGIPYRSPLQ